MSFLLDTVVISELRKRELDINCARWFETARPSELFLSVITVGEIERGIDLQRRRNPKFAQALSEWLEITLQRYADRVLPVTTPIARRWGRMSSDIGHGGADIMIAATAAEHGLTVVTRNVRHFQPTGVRVINPFQPL